MWIGSGGEETFVGGAKALASRLTAAEIPHEFFQLPGPHVLPVFRKELIKLLPRLFRWLGRAVQSTATPRDRTALGPGRRRILR